MWKMFARPLSPFDVGTEVIKLEDSETSDDLFLAQGLKNGKLVRKTIDYSVVDFVEE